MDFASTKPLPEPARGGESYPKCTSGTEMKQTFYNMLMVPSLCEGGRRCSPSCEGSAWCGCGPCRALCCQTLSSWPTYTPECPTAGGCGQAPCQLNHRPWKTQDIINKFSKESSYVVTSLRKKTALFRLGSL